ncbi:MAG: acetyl-CoA carboxylase carboxyltransferase subunit alpha [Nanoarchaeota archaeon]|nr:acetyl-CoA carboxylase carboxyltransferase subunit alpha [Nanoarchaeota archaeon]
METKYLPFEGEVEKIDGQISELIEYGKQKGISYSSEIDKLITKRRGILKNIYSNLFAWDTVQVARHPQRPILEDYINLMVHDFEEMHGDRLYGDDRALIGGLGRIGREKVMIVGHNKGRAKDLEKMAGENMEEKMRYIAGCPNPEGFRKANRLMRYAEKFGIPIVTLIDTPGAYPGIGAEERGQASAIAENLRYMARARVPIVSVVIGEGGSGGALGIGVANYFGALEYSYYSVISPEGCAAILWRNGNEKEEAAETLKLTARGGYELGAIDEVIREPLGGAHRNLRETIIEVKRYILQAIGKLKNMKGEKLVEHRHKMINRRASGTRD